MSRYTVGEFAESGALIVVGSLEHDDPRLGNLMTASFDFPLRVQTLALCESLTPATAKTILGALLYSESPDDVLQLGPGQCEPLGAVEFNFETTNIRIYLLRDEPLLKAMIDGKRRSWREKHARQRLGKQR
jgi:hypothetical protein